VATLVSVATTGKRIEQMSIGESSVEFKLVRKRVASLKPSPENEQIYRAVRLDDPDVVGLAKSINKNGLREPLVVTKDRFVVSGHRRLAALNLVDQKQAYCRVLSCKRSDLTRDEYIALLRDHNRQRVKNPAELVRETMIDIDPDEAWDSLRKRRQDSKYNDRLSRVEALAIEGKSCRHGVSAEKQQHVEHIKKVVFQDRKDYWPLGVRAIHYPLLNYQFERNTRLGLKYANDKRSYDATSDLLTRMRISGDIPWGAITDGTRPTKEYRSFSDSRQFVSNEIERLFDGYWRDLLQSQPNYVEVLVEKNTVFHMAQRVTDKYQIQTTSGRGFSSIDTIHEIHRRYQDSDKARLILIVLSDFDPEGERIPQSVAGSLVTDFGVRERELTVIKAGVTREQIRRYNLQPQNFAKETSSNRDWFVKRNGGDDTVYELEALAPDDMLKDLEDTITSVLDMDLYNAEVANEREEARFLESLRRTAYEAVKPLAQET